MFSSDIEAVIGLKSTTVALVRHVEQKADRSLLRTIEDSNGKGEVTWNHRMTVHLFPSVNNSLGSSLQQHCGLIHTEPQNGRSFAAYN